MGVIERKEREREQRRQQIMQAGSDLFLAQGFSNTTMEQIANQVEISRGTLYLYFENKDDLIINIIIEAMNVFINLMKENIKPEDNTEKQLQSIGNSYLAFHDKYRSYFKLMNFMDNEKLHKEVNIQSKQIFEKSEEIWTIIVNILRNGIDAGFIRDDINPYEIAILFWSASNGVILLMDHMKLEHKENLPPECQEYCTKENQQGFWNANYDNLLPMLWGYIGAGIRKN